MPVIVVANPKGGVGKTTLATNIAGYLAAQGASVMLGDVDRQQSSLTWLGLRPAGLPVIQSWDVSQGNLARPPRGTTHVVLDTPAALHGKQLDEVLRIADKLLIPLQPSILDIHATHHFLESLGAHKQSHSIDVALVGMRTREGLISTDQLRSYLGGLDLQLLGFLRETQNYVHLGAHGLTLWDMASSRFESDLEQWQPILAWLNDEAFVVEDD
ncbi:MAG: ParA family protein [Burkholderiaceae bacterium]